MKYRLFGDSGLRVSEMALGTMTFGEDWGWGSAQDEAQKIYGAYRAAGGNFIDTANVYTNGNSERFRLVNDGMQQFLPEKQRADRVIAAVRSVARELGHSMAQVALAWLRYQAVPVIPIIGARKLVQLEANLASLEVELSAAQLQALDAASRVDLGYPQALYTKELVRALRYGGMADSLLRR